MNKKIKPCKIYLKKQRYKIATISEWQYKIKKRKKEICRLCRVRLPGPWSANEVRFPQRTPGTRAAAQESLRVHRGFTAQ